MKLNLSADEVLTTTRAVRKRLDVSKPVSRAVIEECVEIAMQAPNSRNLNAWHWVVVDDPAKIAKIAELYKLAMSDYYRGDQWKDYTLQLIDLLPKMPAIVVPHMLGRIDGKEAAEQASRWGSVIQAVWSFCLALRERGIGTVWTAITLRRKKEMAELLGIPHDKYTQVCMLPIAYTLGTDFKKGPRRPVSEVLSYNSFTPPQSVGEVWVGESVGRPDRWD